MNTNEELKERLKDILEELQSYQSTSEDFHGVIWTFRLALTSTSLTKAEIKHITNGMEQVIHMHEEIIDRMDCILPSVERIIEIYNKIA
jgi:hypothetical protein